MIFANMPTISKWQQRFITVLFSTVFALRGRLIFATMARFFCSSTSKVEGGLEVSVLALIETETHPRGSIAV